MADFLNVIIDTGHVALTDRETLFPDEELVHVFREDNPKTIFDFLVIIGAFKSKSQAKKNWKGGPIQDGWNEWFIGKKKRHLCIWKPSF